ncbi:MAG: (deoxy)nucleoside triphosphate pyrophosphohydrolase [Methanobacteriota archaeon]|nr:MAG: (deoxy)nucleoside triphosphate pyrophosphohydrolase [Euryarchaeota archaeon]
MKIIPVVAGIVWNEGRILLAQRLKTDRTFPGKWEFPGGKIEPGEHPKDALKRELKEELNLQVHNLRLFEVTTDFTKVNGKDFQFLLIYYEAQSDTKEVVELEVETANWVNPGELLEFDLTPADHLIAMKINKLDY